MRKLFRLIREYEGQDLAEYALLISLIALVAVAVVTLFGTTISGVFHAITASL